MGFVSGAAGKAVAELAVGQKRAGHHVTVVTSKTPAGGVMNQAVLMRKLSDGGVFVHAVDSLASRQTGPNADVVQFIHDHLGTAAASRSRADSASPCSTARRSRAPRHGPRAHPADLARVDGVASGRRPPGV